MSATGRESAVLLYAPGDVLVETPDADLRALVPHRFEAATEAAYLEQLPSQFGRVRQLACLRTLPAPEAVLEMLELLSAVLGTRTLPLTSAQIAVCLGMHRETVDKVLPELKRAGRVRRSYKEFEVLP